MPSCQPLLALVVVGGGIQQSLAYPITHTYWHWVSRPAQLAGPDSASLFDCPVVNRGGKLGPASWTVGLVSRRAVGCGVDCPNDKPVPLPLNSRGPDRWGWQDLTAREELTAWTGGLGLMMTDDVQVAVDWDVREAGREGV
jgi:hypothetical protein